MSGVARPSARFVPGTRVGALVDAAVELRGNHPPTPASTWRVQQGLKHTPTLSTVHGLPATRWVELGRYDSFGTASSLIVPTQTLRQAVACGELWTVAAVALFDEGGTTHYFEPDEVQPTVRLGQTRPGRVLDCTALLEVVVITELLEERSRRGGAPAPEAYVALATAAVMSTAVEVVHLDSDDEGRLLRRAELKRRRRR